MQEKLYCWEEVTASRNYMNLFFCEPIYAMTLASEGEIAFLEKKEMFSDKMISKVHLYMSSIMK